MGNRFAKAGFYWLIGFKIFLAIVNIINMTLQATGKIQPSKKLLPVM
ncbi:MAG: hypothetical protein WAM88_07415 [Nitrososphaeraceae archaeon]